MRRLLFYIFINMSFISRLINDKWYMYFIVKAHKSQGVHFIGTPEYIQKDAYLDPSGGLTIYQGVVISTRVIVLTHDWSFLKRPNNQSTVEYAFKSVSIEENSFIGAGAIILPGTRIGKHCIIGAGAVIKGVIEDYSILIGNPAKKIGDTRKSGK
ncbi:acyltransferase [Phocaeicola sp. HCN-6420]|uniref:acyltransferase n=1 Tax=Phocaeicola sp. HCN-6420 TaxID=3134673 RepID=UPI0030C0CC0C